MARIFVHGECYIEELAYSIEERFFMVFSEKNMLHKKGMGFASNPIYNNSLGGVQKETWGHQNQEFPTKIHYVLHYVGNPIFQCKPI